MKIFKKILKAALGVLSLISFYSCATVTNNAGFDRKTVKISSDSTLVCFGDSLTYGHGADHDTESWPSLLQQKITIPVIN